MANPVIDTLQSMASAAVSSIAVNHPAALSVFAGCIAFAVVFGAGMMIWHVARYGVRDADDVDSWNRRAKAIEAGAWGYEQERGWLRARGEWRGKRNFKYREQAFGNWWGGSESGAQRKRHREYY